MRFLVVLAAIFVTACSVNVNGKGHGGYSFEIRAVGDTHVYVVRGPDGKMAAARSGGGESALLNADELQHALAAMPAPHGGPAADDNGGQTVSINAPGFHLRASGDDNSDDADTTTHAATSHGDHGGNAQISMNIAGFSMNVDADDGGPGDADDRAHVSVSGLSEHDARRFIAEQDDLSPQVQSQMLAALGLSENGADDADQRLAGGKGKDGKPSGK
jgi:hypothetical protein